MDEAIVRERAAEISRTLGNCKKFIHQGNVYACLSGFKDVLEKTRELNPRLLRWPGGTYTKIHHWQDGVGPKEERRKRPNLIWGGIEDHL
ncbi:MAG: hypothetical protein MUE76_07560, partial [Syntrophales bacterium]|nr:hypothetical protein [Syntrophales bacterium]